MQNVASWPFPDIQNSLLLNFALTPIFLHYTSLSMRLLGTYTASTSAPLMLLVKTNYEMPDQHRIAMGLSKDLFNTTLESSGKLLEFHCKI